MLQEEYKDLTAEKLANFALISILSKSGEQKKDGIRYLLAIKNYGIKTALSDEYEMAILKNTHSKSLQEAIEKWDIKRRLAAEDLAKKNIQL